MPRLSEDIMPPDAFHTRKQVCFRHIYEASRTRETNWDGRAGEKKSELALTTP